MGIFNSITYLIITAVIAIVNYVFRAIGLYVLAKRKNLSIKWFAFLPFVSSYLLGRLAGETVLINARIKNTGLMLLIADIANFVLSASYYILANLPYIKDMIADRYNIIELLNGSVQKLEYTVGAGVQALQVITRMVNLGYIFLFISVMITLFRKYSPNNYFLFSIISVLLSVEGIFIFAVRKNKEVNYSEFIKAKYAQFYKNRPNPYDPYNPNNNNPYNNNPYNNNPYNRNANPYNPYQNPNNNPEANQQSKPEEPFKEFSETKTDEPFSEIFNKKDGQDKSGEKKDNDIFH